MVTSDVMFSALIYLSDAILVVMGVDQRGSGRSMCVFVCVSVSFTGEGSFTHTPPLFIYNSRSVKSPKT